MLRPQQGGRFGEPELFQQPKADPLTLPEVPVLPPAEFFDATSWAAYEADVAPLPQVAFDQTLALGTLAALEGTGLEAAAVRLATEAAMEPEQATAMVSAVESMFKDIVGRAVKADGMAAEDLPAFYVWARGQRGLQSAISDLTGQRDVSAFRRMASQFSAIQARHAGVNA